MLRLARHWSPLFPSMMALKVATTTSDENTSEDSDLHQTIADLFTVKVQQQVDAHRNEEQYASLNGIYLFHIHCTAWSSPLFWTLDLKSGLAYEGKPKGGQPALTTYLVEAHDLVALLNGKLNTAHAYLTGKLKLLGNTAAAFKFQHFINETLETAKEEEIASLDTKETMTPSAVLSGIATDGLKCDVVFEMIKGRLATEAELVAKMPFVVEVNVLKDKAVRATWTIDTRTPGGLVYRGAATTKADATLSIDDDEYMQLLFGKLTPQRAFIKGLVKVKGNILLLQRLDQLWNRLQKTRRDPELPFFKDLLLTTQLQEGLLSETVFFEVITRFVRSPGLLPKSTAIRFSITKNGALEAQWLISYDDSGQLCPVKHQNRLATGKGHLAPIAGHSDLELVIEDADLALLTRFPAQYQLTEAIASSRVVVRGDVSLVPKLSQLFSRSQMKAKL